ncbi:MAG: septal ring lytic transglycosylase RlpA family protein [Bacteroidales bacterium]|nr:septal ring lytic transglycosylase RlpA family protein [Bacteroidales bacterium]
MILALACALPVFAPENKAKMQMYATYYHNRFSNRQTSTGEIFSQRKYTAAHKTLPLNTLVKVTNKANLRSVIVKINDRCPNPYVIDLSLIAAKRILMHNIGTAVVNVERLDSTYTTIWERQDEMYRCFDRAEFNSKLATLQENMASQKFNDTFLFLYYIKMSNIGDEQRAKEIIRQLSETLQQKSSIRKENNQYYIYIGGFLTREKVVSAIIDLHSSYYLPLEVVKM